MARDLRMTLAIMVAVLVLCAPAIFAQSDPLFSHYNYLAAVFHQVVPTNTPTPTIPVLPTKTPVVATPTKTPLPPTPTHTPVPPTATPTLPPPSYSNCQADPNPSAAPNYPVQITSINKVAEDVTLKNVSGDIIDLSGWNMCSITGNQHHPISGTLAPGQSQTFNSGSSIWNNSSPDPGALYNPNGQLVSYFNS